jgi:heavy metal translocating P-type ATPase
LHREYRPEQMRLGVPSPPHGNDDHVHRHHHHGEPAHDHEHDPNAERRWLWAVTAVVGLLLVADVVLAALESPWQRPFGVPLALAAAVIGGGRVVYLALAALFEGSIGADIALAIACIAAACLGEYFVAAEVVFIALVGECLEALTFERAQRAIGKLLDFYPRTAHVIRGDTEVDVPIEGVAVGDRVVVRPGERISVDGMVVRGRSAVDQAVLTGESMPVDKGEGDNVFTGTVNQFGRLEVRADKLGNETTLGQVIRLLADAQRHRSPLERTADRYARIFLPAVLTVAAIVFMGTNGPALWRWFMAGAAPAIDLLPALAVLVVACPCALVLATPAAVLAATARLAQRGVLVKSGAAIEGLARVNTIAFDKTGTLTDGKPELGDCLTLSATGADVSDSQNEVIRLAAAAEQPSEHPLARLLVAEAGRRGLALPEIDDFQAQPGAGVLARLKLNGPGEAQVRPTTLLVGNLRLVREHGVTVDGDLERAIEALDRSGQTALILVRDGQVLGVIGARDRVRRAAHDVIHELKHLGLTDLAILTGDRAAPARAVAKKVHIQQVEFELTPAGKVDWIEGRRHDGRVVAMVGDGINDAPALARADVGLAFAGVSGDLAAEAGSIVLLSDPLAALPETIRLARQTVRIIHQNILLFAFAFNAMAVALAGLRIMGPVAAAIVHQIGSLLVLLNAIRLLGFERWHTYGFVRAGEHVVSACRRCRPSVMLDRAWRRRRGIIRTAVVVAALAYLGSGVTMIEPGQAGLLRRFGRFRPPLLSPGLHVRWPAPFESVIVVEPDRSRLARIGLPAQSPAAVNPVGWNATHGVKRDESALFFTGDENLVELAGVVEYRFNEAMLAELFFHVADVENTVARAAEGTFREVVGRTPLEAILVSGRSEFEGLVAQVLQQRLHASGLAVLVERVRVVDAHPPREVVPAFRDVSSAVSDAERSRNQAHADAAQRHWSAIAEAAAIRNAAKTRADSLVNRATGEKAAFLAKAASQASAPALSEFRLLWDTLAISLPGRPKLILDRRAAGRRHLWLADPGQLSPALGRALAPVSSEVRAEEPND